MHRQWIGLVGAAVLGVVAMVAWDADAARQATAPTVVGTVDLPKVLNEQRERAQEAKDTGQKGNIPQLLLIEIDLSILEPNVAMGSSFCAFPL